MAGNKTVANDCSPTEYIRTIEPEQKRADAQWLLKLCERLTGERAKMWGPSIVGCGSYHYKYVSGREGDLFLAGFSARKSSLVVYVLGYLFDEQDEILSRLGRHKMGKACLYIKRLADIDRNVLEELVTRSITATRQRYPD